MPQPVEQVSAQAAQAANDASVLDHTSREPNEPPPPAGSPTFHDAAREMSPVAVDDGLGFDLSGWEAEEDQAPPEGDPTLAVAAVQIQAAITEHQPIDTSADWDDFDAFLPDRATPLPRADDAEARERLRLVVRSVKTDTYQVTPRSNLFQRNTTGDALISAMPLRMRCFRSSLEVTRMCRRNVRAILEKAHSIKLSQEPCLGV